MIVTFSRPQGKLFEGDLIALTKNGRHIGYGTVKIILEDKVLLEVDNGAEKTFNELYGEAIPFDSDLII